MQPPSTPLDGRPTPDVGATVPPVGRVVIDRIRPRTPTGFAAKAVVDHPTPVSAVAFRDGHSLLAARVRWQEDGVVGWASAPLEPTGNDEWEGSLLAASVGHVTFVVEVWTDRFATWRRDLRARVGAGDDVSAELLEGALILEELAPLVAETGRARVLDAVAQLRRTDCALEVRLNAGLDDAVAQWLHGVPDPSDLTASPGMPLFVERERAAVGAWYELFPRSEGGLAGAAKRLDAVAGLGFDIVYLPPIHPIGTTARKGRNNTLTPTGSDPGSPWAIGSPAGGHTAIAPELGDFDDFEQLVERAGELGMEIALDYALQCSPDHPWVTQHPEWFFRRPDGSIRYAENPPKKYQDIYPINFWPEAEADRVALWEACRDILLFWAERGVKVFRVDNPHTKPVAFWAWVLADVRREHPDAVFLAEAFTAPKMMSKLGEVGFSQSYTYFTWRTERWELEEYVGELAHTELADWFRPNFWPNTPDILAAPLRNGPRSAFELRVVLAALLSPSYGIYSGYELCENEPASEANEEYLNAEKYEVRSRDWDSPTSIAPLVGRLNEIRRAEPAFAELGTTRFHGASHQDLICWSKTTPSGDHPVLVVVNLNPHEWREGTLDLDLGALGMPAGVPFEAHDLLSGATFRWDGPTPYVRLDPSAQVAHVLHLSPLKPS